MAQSSLMCALPLVYNHVLYNYATLIAFTVFLTNGVAVIATCFFVTVQSYLGTVCDMAVCLSVDLSTSMPHAGSAVVRIDPLHFLAGCHKR